jgi:hypothetical protein
MTLISLSGRKHSGKTELANICATEYGYTILNFADGLKDIVCEILHITRDYLDENKETLETYLINEEYVNVIHKHISVEKSVITNLLPLQFISIRNILQFVGSEIIREYDPEWHIRRVKKLIDEDPYRKWCIGDCRYKNEKQMIDDMNGEAWFIMRPSNFEISNHSSETDLLWPDFGFNIIVNNTDVESLHLKWRNYLETTNKNMLYYRATDTFEKTSFLEKTMLSTYCLNLLKSRECIKDGKICFIENDMNVMKPMLMQFYGPIHCAPIFSEGGYTLYCDNPYILENIKLYI